MIGKLRGTVDAVGTDFAIIDVGGVGYEVSCPTRTLSSLTPGQAVTLSIETYVREDAIKLYGFPSDAERGWFRLLQSVQGVGAKVALAILSTLDARTLANAIALQDRAAVSRAPGVGPKVALRIVNELKDKAPVTATVSVRAGDANGSAATALEIEKPMPSPASDAISALTNLGYSAIQANAAISVALSKAGEAAKTQDLIRLGLKELSQ
jgi:Holliday junction DNA helicase RuvA